MMQADRLTATPRSCAEVNREAPLPFAPDALRVLRLAAWRAAAERVDPETVTTTIGHVLDAISDDARDGGQAQTPPSVMLDTDPLLGRILWDANVISRQNGLPEVSLRAFERCLDERLASSGMTRQRVEFARYLARTRRVAEGETVTTLRLRVVPGMPHTAGTGALGEEMSEPGGMPRA